MLLELVMLGAWTALVVYVSWFFFKAKTVQPLTIDDLALTWKVHKRQKGCNASRIHSLLKENDEVVGFKCDCGFEFIQKRLITQTSHERMPSPSVIQEQIPNTWKGDCLLFLWLPGHNKTYGAHTRSWKRPHFFFKTRKLVGTLDNHLTSSLLYAPVQ